MKINVYYPSGYHFTVSGDWDGPGSIEKMNVIKIVLDEDLRLSTAQVVHQGVAAIMDEGPVLKKGSLFFGDPRGVYQVKDSGVVLYNPRDAMVGMEKVWLDWLKEHPEWPGVLELSV